MTATTTGEMISPLHHLIITAGPTPPPGQKPPTANESSATLLLEAGLATKSGRKLTPTEQGWSAWLTDSDDAQKANALVQLLRLVDDRGGSKLTATQIKWAEPHLTGLALDDELITKLKASTYELTETGRHYLIWNLPEAEGELLKQAWQAQDEALLAELLQTVESKAGKALTAKQQQTYATLIERAESQSLIEPAGKKNAWTLTEAGAEWLFSRLPAEEQIAELERRRGQLESGLRAVRSRLSSDLASVADETSAPIQEAEAELGSELEADLERLSTRLAPLQALLDTTAVLKSVEASVRARLLEGERKAQAAAVTRLAEQSEATRELTAKQKQLEQTCQELTTRIEQVGSRPASEANGQPSSLNTTTDESRVFAEVKAAYERVHERKRRISGSVSIPEVADELDGTLPREECRRLLGKWHRERRLTLQVCNTPSIVDRPDEGISSEQGLLYYIRYTGE